MVTKNIITSKYTKEGVKKLLSEVDDIVTKGKATDKPEKLLKKKAEPEVSVDGKKIELGETKIGVKNFKGKIPEASKESVEEFLASFQSNNIPKKILADFNIDKITNNEDIIKMINLIAKTANKKDIVAQTRGVQKQSTTKAIGTKYAKNDDFIVNVLGTKAGQTYNAGQIYGIRQMLEAGMTRLDYLAKKATADLANEGDILRFRQHYALMAQIQKVLLGVRTETARALNQFKIPTDASKKVGFIGGNVDDLNRKSLLVELGGADEVVGMAKLYLRAPNDVAKKLNAIEKSGLQKFSDATSEIFINVILSNPLTHVRNSAGNWIAQAIVSTERKIAANSFRAGTGEGLNYIAPYEDIAKVWGKTMAAKEIMGAMSQIYKLGGSKVETKLGQVTAQNFGVKNKTGGQLIDLLGKGLTLNNYPTKMLKVADDYFKNREFRSEVYAMAFSEGMEMFQKGLLKKDDIAKFIASRVQNPTKEIIEKAYSAARYTSFQTQLGKRGDFFDVGAIAQKGKNVVQNRSPFSFLTNYYLPFVQTPTNIAGFVAERTPVLAQILTNYNQKIAAGGKEAALAKAQLQLGSYVYLIGSMLGFYGVTRGSDIRLDLNKIQGGERLLQKTTKTEPFQIEIPIGEGKYQKISFSSFDPISQMFANSASGGQYMALLGDSFYDNVFQQENKIDGLGMFGKDFLNFSLGMSYVIGQNISNSTMLAGAGKFVDDATKITSGAMTGNLGKATKEVASEFTTSFIPTVFRQAGKVYNSLEGDNFQKISTEFMEYAKKNMNDNDLEFDYDLRGRKYDKFMYFSQFERDKIDEELYRVRPTIYPIKNSYRYTYSGLIGESVNVKLNSREKRWFRQNVGIVFDSKLKELVDSRHYKNANLRWVKQGLIENAWEESKEQVGAWFKDPNKANFTDENGVQQSYIGEIKIRADELKNKKIFSKQSGEQEVGGFLPIEDATTSNLLEPN